MDLNAGQRKAVFALIVVVLAGLGVYMFVPGARGSRGAAGPAATHRPAPPATHAPAASPGPSPSAAASAASSAPDIYRWLPFTQAQLGAAAGVVTEFADAYGTWSYSQNAAGYVGTMTSLITSQLAPVIKQGYSVPGVASQRTAQKQVSTGSALIDSLRAFGTSSITFVVTITEQITDTAGRSQRSTQYAVTVVATGSNWQVNDIELASAGNS
jgi:hypothetical protein